MKRLLSLSVFLMMAMLSFAHDFEVDGICYNITSTDPLKVEVTNNNKIGNSYYSGSVTIPQTVTYSGKTYSVTSIGKYVFSGCSGLTSVTIPNSVTSIGSSAFNGCSGLTKVIVPDIAAWCNISFGNYAANPLYYAKHIFSDENTEITDLVIPNSVTSIGYEAFYGCSGLTSVTIPNSVTSIGSSAFEDCSGLKSVTIGNSVTSIGYGAFSGCNNLTLVEINSNTFLSQSHERDGLRLNNIFGTQVQNYVIGNDVTSIGHYAFSGCSGLTSVTIPNSVTSIGNSAFNDCENLSSIYVPKGSLSLFRNVQKVNYTIYEVDNGVTLSETTFSSPTTFSTYYDYDGDGVMEYLSTNGFYDKQGNLKKEIPDMRFDRYGKTLATPINGQGELLVYDYEHDRDYFYRPEEYYKNVVGHDELQGNTYSLLADIDNDGRKDLVSSFSSGDKFTIFYQQPDGTFKAMEQSAVMDQDAAKIAQSSSGGGGIAPFSQGMMVKAPKHKAPGSSSFETGYCTGVDMNDDGILDLMNNGTSVLYSYADNKFFIGTKDKSLYPCDLNGDGELDYVCYDGNNLVLQIRTSGTEFTEKTLFTNSNVRQVIYKDFDHDGDIDFLVYMDDADRYGHISATYFVFFRNDGELSFKRKERNFSANYQLKAIKDVDADGLYEMHIVDETNKAAKILKIGTDLSVTETDNNLSDGIYDNPKAIGDFDNDGIVDYRYTIGNGTKYGYFTKTVNTAPKKMEAPTAVLDAGKGRLRINWKQGTDTETSACDLTYELRIGTQPASGDVLFGASLADGRRRLLEDGNMGRNLSTLFNANSLKPGIYYISVQAIDAGGRGGEWSDDFEYEHQVAAPVIVSNYINQMSTADTLQLNVKTPIDGATYQWTLSEGKILKTDGSYAECIFEHDGPHTVSLAMTVDGRTMNAEPMSIEVLPVKYAYYSGDPGFIDINQDGYPEYLCYTNDGKGNIEKVLLSYTTTVGGGYSGVSYIDYNMDGYPDAISGNNVLINAGDQDNDFEMETQAFSFEQSSDTSFGSVYGIASWFDANNDGYLDNNKYYNDGTNINWNMYYSPDAKYALYDNYGNIVNREWNDTRYYLGIPNYDVNRDGMLDIVQRVLRNPSWDYTMWYVMLKDSTSNISYATPQLMYDTEGRHNSWWIEDMNNDGYADLLYLDGQNLVIVKGKATMPYTETVTYEVPLNWECLHLHDYNNDGYVDLFGKYDYGKKYCLMKFGPDFSMEIMNFPSGLEGGHFMVQKDGGYPDGNASNIRNLPPSAPSTVAAKQTKDGLLIKWSDAQDDHTPAMQMRYNISVKRKGKKGDNSFVISPMNGLKDEATICGAIMYKKSTQMLVPASVLTAGETYEIQVQAIDLWNQHSPMTKAVEFTMTGDGYIDVAEQVAVGKEATVKFVGANTNSYSLNAGADATIVSNLGKGQFVVKWATEGVKELALTAGTKTVKSAVTVVKPVDLTFSVPAQVFAGAPLTISISDDMAAQPKDVGLRVVNNNKVQVEYAAGSKMATVTFPETGTYTLEAYSDDAIRGGSYRQTVNVTAKMPTAAIEQVDVDEETGFYTVKWSASTLPAGISKVVVKKEGRALGAFNEIATVDAGDGQYIDRSSNPAVQSSRYSIQLMADNEQVSEMSTPHKPLHVMIVDGMSGYSLIWDSYEGQDIATYNIMRGSSPNNLQKIAQVSGSLNSYTDLSPSSGITYYAVTFDRAETAGGRNSNRAPESDWYVYSNIISTKDALAVVPATSLEIIVLDDFAKLTDEHPELQLYSLILPTYASVPKVQWDIIGGSGLASVSYTGKLTAIGGEGVVLVRATTVDGSALSAFISIPVKVTPGHQTGIAELTNESRQSLGKTRFYTADGKQTDKLRPGLNIIRLGDGTVKKVLVK